jgi:hypothetical protein
VRRQFTQSGATLRSAPADGGVPAICLTVAPLTEIARVRHALIVDLIDRVAELEARAGSRDSD